MTGRGLPPASGPDHTTPERDTHDLLSFHEEEHHHRGDPDRNANHHSPEHHGETGFDKYPATDEETKEKDSEEIVSSIESDSLSGITFNSNHGRLHVSCYPIWSSSVQHNSINHLFFFFFFFFFLPLWHFLAPFFYFTDIQFFPLLTSFIHSKAQGRHCCIHSTSPSTASTPSARPIS